MDKSKGTEIAIAAVNGQLLPCSPRYLIRTLPPRDIPIAAIFLPGYRFVNSMITELISPVSPE